MTQQETDVREPLALLGVAALVLAWSGIQPLERGTWWMEVRSLAIFPNRPILKHGFGLEATSSLQCRQYLGNANKNSCC